MSCDDELTFPRFCQVAVGLLVQRLSAVTFVWVTRRISVTKIWVVRARIEYLQEQGGNPFRDYQLPEAVLALNLAQIEALLGVPSSSVTRPV